MGCTPYYMPRKVEDLRYCTGDEATEFVKVLVGNCSCILD